MYGMARGVEWVEAPPGEGGGVRPADVEEQIRDLRDQVRRLQEQVVALAGQRIAKEPLLTHVEGLDAALGGGLPRGHVVLMAGPTGAMKTSLALYILAKNRVTGARGLYVTVEESRASIVRTASRLGLGEADDYIVDVGRLRLEHSGVEDARDWVQILRDYLVRRREREPIELVVIDSLDGLETLARLRNERADLFHFLNFLRTEGFTTILLRDRDWARPEGNGSVDSLVDGILELRFTSGGAGRVQLLVRCVKMRHASPTWDYYVLTYADGKFVTRPYANANRPPS